MYSVCDTFAGGFPHSEVSGSKLICQLPEAYRRLSRPSSPIIAKASTTCSYSLDPITLTFLAKHKSCFKECLSGLSPDALCRNVNYSLVLLPENDSSLLEIKTKFKFRFDAIKKLSLAARCALNLYECALSANNADSTL